jgi:hypothetical protein
MKPETLNKFHAVQTELLNMEGDLIGLADAFAVTGNEYMALKLERHMARLKDAHEVLQEAIGEDIGELVKQTGRANHNMIVACLAVASKDKEFLKAMDLGTEGSD